MNFVLFYSDKKLMLWNVNYTDKTSRLTRKLFKFDNEVLKSNNFIDLFLV
jgi:hypothetical protein